MLVGPAVTVAVKVTSLSAGNPLGSDTEPEAAEAAAQAAVSSASPPSLSLSLSPQAPAPTNASSTSTSQSFRMAAERSRWLRRWARSHGIGCENRRDRADWPAEGPTTASGPEGTGMHFVLATDGLGPGQGWLAFGLVMFGVLVVGGGLGLAGRKADQRQRDRNRSS